MQYLFPRRASITKVDGRLVLQNNMLCVLHVILFHESCHMFIYMYLLMHLVGVFFPSVIVYRWFLLLASYDGKTNLSDSLPFKIQLFFYKLFLLKSHLFVCCKKKKMLFTDFTISIHQRQKIHITFSTEIWSSTALVNIYNNLKCLLSSILDWFLKIMWHWCWNLSV